MEENATPGGERPDQCPGQDLQEEQRQLQQPEQQQQQQGDTTEHPKRKRTIEEMSESELREALKERDRALERERQERQERDQERDQLDNGTYFATISKLWEGKEMEGPSGENGFRLKDAGQSISTNKTTSNSGSNEAERYNWPYQKTCDALLHGTGVPVDDRESTSQSTATKRAIFPTDIFGRTIIAAEVAHLVPRSFRNATTYWFLPPWLFGASHRSWKWEDRMKAIHGERERGKNTKRKNLTGIKHSPTNMAKISGQKFYLDDAPCLIIIPICNKEQVNDWDGSGYKAIVVIDGWEGEATVTAKEVAGFVGLNDTAMLKEENHASSCDIETATQLLAFTVRSIHTARQCSENSDYLDQENKKYDGNRGTLHALPNICYPVLRGPASSHKVCKISFAGHGEKYNPSKPERHPAPDPMLLVTRAAVTFSRRHFQTLAAAAEPREDDWNEDDELAGQMYLKETMKSLRPPEDREELARRLGQHPDPIR